MNFNQQQLEAINARGCSVLVSAPAGSGKTRILVNRVVDLLIKDHYEIDEFLILTFTDAAANEMKQRLSALLMDTLSDDSLTPSQIEHARLQLSKLPNASISTFHSFCKDLLERYGYLVGVMPGFKINEKPQYIQHQTIEQCLLKWVKEPQFQDFFHRHVGAYNFDAITDLILQYHSLSHGYVDFSEFIKSQENFDPLTSDVYLKTLKTIMGNECLKAMSRLAILAQYANVNGLSTFFEASAKLGALNDVYYEYLDDMLMRIREASSPQEVYDALSCKAPRYRAMSWKEVDEDIKKTFNSLKKKVLEPFSRKVKALVPDSLDGFETVLTLSYEDIHYLLGAEGLLEQFQKAYSQAKKERNELDFADLEHYATLLLDDSLPIKEELYYRFKEIMIDEYQDTNQIQENMVMAISEYSAPHIPLFMVGDMKQSIYRFRQADPTIFKTKYQTFKTDSESPLRRIDLHHNYRSHKRVLDSINYIFDQIMDENVGDLEYYHDPSAWLNDDPNVHHKSIETLDREPDHETELLINVYDNTQIDYDKNELEAHMVAQHIKSLVEKTDYDFKDIAVLMATTTHFVTYKKIFNRYNIPAIITLSEGLFESNEVKALMSLLKVLVNPYDHIAMLSVLRAPFVFTHFDENTLLSLRKEGEALYESCLNSEDGRIKNALTIIKDLRKLTFSCSPYEILIRCLEVTGYQSYVSTLLNGEQRSANIDMLLELFHKNDRYPYLEDYLQVLEADSSASPGMIVDDDNNAVNFMTIHKSKGLEFSVVYVCNMNHQFSNLDIQSKILLDAHLGVSMDARVIRTVGTYDDVNVQYHNPYRSLMAQAINKDNRSEYMRLLYVALTRAANKLVLTGSVNDLDQIATIFDATMLNEEDPSVNASDSIIYNLNLRETNNFLDWILMAIARHPDMYPLHSEVGTMPHYSMKVINALKTPATKLAKFAFTLHKSKDVIDLIPDYKHTESLNRYNEVQHLYEYQYPYEDQLRSIAVTTLQAIEDEQRDLIINVDGPRRENALTLGTNVHELLSHLDFKNDDPQALLETLTDQGLFTKDDYDMLIDYMPHIIEFVNSETYHQIAQAHTIMKEKPFRFKSNGQIINGIFDLVFITDDMIYVLDYKTDHITSNNSLEALKEKHRLQLDYYSDVLRHYYHRDVTGMVYYLETNQCVTLSTIPAYEGLN